MDKSTGIRNIAIENDEITSRRDILIAGIASLVICILTYFRLYFGVNFTDEAYYIAIPMRFINGDMPFRDDATTLFSMFSFISYPFLKVYHHFNGSNEGIVLFCRHLYFSFLLMIAGVLYHILRRLASLPESLLISSCVIAFIPFNIHAISYNTLAAGLLTAGFFSGAWGSCEGLRRYSLLSGFLLGLCVIAYPPMLIPALAALLVTTLQDRKSFFPTCTGAFMALLCVFPLVIHADFATLQSNFAYVSSIGEQGRSILKILAVIWNSLSRLWLGLLAAGTVIVLYARSRSPKLRIGVALVPLLLALPNRFPKGQVSVAAHGYVFALALLGLLLYSNLDGKLRRFFLLVWVPAAVATLVIGYSSSNGYLNMGIGFLAGGLLCLLLLSKLIGRTSIGTSGNRLLQLAMLIGAASVLVYYQYASAYSESKIFKLTTSIDAGPYKYLRTTQQKAEFSRQLTTDLQSTTQGSSSIVFYYDFPAGYLFTPLKPATNSVWLFSPGKIPSLNTSQLEQLYSLPERQPDVIFRMESTLWGDDIHKHKLIHVPYHPIDKLISSGKYRVSLERREYTVYRKI